MGKTERILKVFILSSVSALLTTGLLCCVIIAGENTESILHGTDKDIVSYAQTGKNPFAFFTGLW